MALLSEIKDIQSGRVIVQDAASDEHWVTIKGAHVLVDGEGKVIGGPKKFHGKYIRSQMPSKEDHKPTQATSKGSLTSNIKGIEKSLDSFDFEQFHTSKDPSKYIKDKIESLFKELGLDSKIKVAPDAEFNEAFKNAKISSFGRMMGGVSSVTAGYRSDSNTVWMRESKINQSLKSKNDYRLFLNSLFHEVGHAYHADVLGIKQQDKGEYGSGWCEEFADTFSSTMGYRLKNEQILKNPSGFSSKLVETAKKYDFKKAIENGIVELIKEHGKGK